MDEPTLLNSILPVKRRPIRVEGDVAYVTLTKGHIAIIDAADVPLIEGRLWRAKKSIYTLYAVSSRPGTATQVRMHVLIMGEMVGMEVDHIDLNGLNNRRSNLRHVTRQQNNINRGIMASNTSGFRGVGLCKRTGVWRAFIKHNYKQIAIGSYATPEQAARAFDAVAIRLRGTFAVLNFPHVPPTEKGKV